MTRVAACIAVVFIALAFPWWAALAAALWYALTYRAYELVVLGALVDAQFAGTLTIPYYAVTAALIVIVLESAKPFFSFYEAV